MCEYLLIANLVLCVHVVVYVRDGMLVVKLTFVRALHRALAGTSRVYTRSRSFNALFKDWVTSTVVNGTRRVAKNFSSSLNGVTYVARWTLKCITGF